MDHDGRELACKLQYPDMQSAVEADIRQLKAVFAIHRRYDATIETSLREAAEAYRAGLALRPFETEGHYALGNVLFAMGDVAGAIASYREAEHKPYVMAAMILLGRFDRPDRVLSQLLGRGRPRRLAD